MKYLKKILLAFIILFIGIQFIIPVRNESEQVLSIDISKTFNVPDSVLSVLKISCYDCHSNNTNYPWYSNIQPVAWLLDSDVKNGKDKLNFSEFGSYTKRRQQSKLRSIISQIQDNKMPISNYTIMHKNAVLTTRNKTLITSWLNKTRESLSILN